MYSVKSKIEKFIYLLIQHQKKTANMLTVFFIFYSD